MTVQCGEMLQWSPRSSARDMVTNPNVASAWVGASMEPSLFSEGYEPTALPTATPRRGFNGALALQRGIYGPRPGRAKGRAASMEPSLFSEGYLAARRRTTNASGQASMEPSLFSEGYRRARRRSEREHGASMEPSLFSDGYTPGRANRASVPSLLQWSPRSSARDMTLPNACCAARRSGFNGALALQRGILLWISPGVVDTDLMLPLGSLA